jgi:osmotically-inducible protein OsmY
MRETVGDYALEASVRAKLVEEAGVNGINLHVLSRNGNVTIAGDVPSKDVADTIRSAAQSVRGVKHVVATLNVHS